MQDTIHKSVGIVCFNKENSSQVLIVKHGRGATHLTGSVGLPSGRPEEGESDIQIAVREFIEETGLSATQESFEDLGFPFEPVPIERKDGIKKFSWHLFLCKNYSGDLKDTDETAPEWIEINKLEKMDNLLPNTLGGAKKGQDYLKNNIKTSMIVALDDKRGIGKGGKMPWHIPADLARFRQITSHHVVIMGRKTLDSLPNGVLPNRINIIVTRDLNYKNPNAIVAHSLEQAVKIAREKEKRGEVFIIGGGQIFELGIDLADKLYLTRVEGDYHADTFFPDYSKFKKITFEEKGESNGFHFTFTDLEK